MKEKNGYQENDTEVLTFSKKEQSEEFQEKEKSELDFWLMQNIKIMEALTVKEPVSWSEQDWGG